ncbi:uncharacterized protein LOC114532409 [Dendronephthya gigantea]|uniref:uncharacterized protein LOC114532409 n=1 Tax=Dendronephthya gigantea TaxID=151771 RepID=UPI00106DAC44|nr:uncharacterized protein LOC114532409 [Dendronephthya gigantea]
MQLKQTSFLLLLLAFVPLKAYGFTFTLKPVGSTTVTAAPGDIITYNAHIIVSETTPLSFHVSLPFSQTPILNVEKIEVIGKGKNLHAGMEQFTYANKDSNSFESQSQASIDFGNVTRNSGSSKPGDDLVVQVQARMLEHSSIKTGAVFWLYFGMHYLNDAVWVVGKSVKAELRSGPANVGVSLKIPPSLTPLIKTFKFNIDIYHLPNSKGSASSLTITLSTPSTLTTPEAKADGPSPSFQLSTTNGITITFSEPFKVGQKARIIVTMTYAGSEKGKFVYGNIYGSFQYETALAGGSCSELQTVEKKDELQLPFKMYSQEDTCEEPLNTGSSVEVNSAYLPCCSATYISTSASKSGAIWLAWKDVTGARLADEYIQYSFDKKTTVRMIVTKGHVPWKVFVRSYHVSYSQNGVHWKYVTHIGKKKEFKANTDGLHKALVLFPKPLNVWFLRIHVVKHSPLGIGMKVKLYGCEDNTATKPYEVHQRGFIAASAVLILCNVHPDRMKAKPNCYISEDDGLKWKPMHSSIVNMIGHDSSTGKNYAMGVTSEDTPFYMEVLSAQSVRVITEADWNAVKSACVLPIVIPMYPVHGNPLYQLTGTSVTVGTITYVASPEGLLKIEGGNTKMIASWTEYK